jgi:hypothetical protein
MAVTEPDEEPVEAVCRTATRRSRFSIDAGPRPKEAVVFSRVSLSDV